MSVALSTAVAEVGAALRACHMVTALCALDVNLQRNETIDSERVWTTLAKDSTSHESCATFSAWKRLRHCGNERLNYKQGFHSVLRPSSVLASVSGDVEHHRCSEKSQEASTSGGGLIPRFCWRHRLRVKLDKVWT